MLKAEASVVILACQHFSFSAFACQFSAFQIFSMSAFQHFSI
jgi:hypothetical protein